MRAFIIPGDHTHLAQFAASVNSRVCGILIHHREPLETVQLPAMPEADDALCVLTLHTLRQLGEFALDESGQRRFDALRTHIFGDERVHYLAQRSHRDSAFNNAIMIEKIVHNSLAVISQTGPTCLISSSSPHSLEAFVFAKCFEFLGLPVFVLENTPVASRSWICKGLDRHEVLLRGGADSADALSPITASLVQTQRASVAGATDKDGYRHSRMYLNTMQGADSNKWWSYRRELSSVLGGRMLALPIRLYASWRKRRLLSSYLSLASNELPSGPFVVFFMHYQPERSTLPIAGSYVQQWLAIRQMSQSLPDGWTLVVREHPTTWYRPLDIDVRTVDFYSEIAALDNTVIGSMDVDTFDLIDACAAAATLTGNSGFQSLMRNKPVIVFGLAAYKDHPACIRVSNMDELRSAFEQIDRGELERHFSDETLDDYLRWMERHSYCVDPQNSNWMQSRLNNFASIYERIFSGDLVLG